MTAVLDTEDTDLLLLAPSDVARAKGVALRSEAASNLRRRVAMVWHAAWHFATAG
jgi:hypothetical protein